MDAARRIEGAKVTLPTSVRTAEIIAKVLRRKGDGLAKLEQERREMEAKRMQAEAEVGDLVSFSGALSSTSFYGQRWTIREVSLCRT
jgi:hypothetical protein